MGISKMKTLLRALRSRNYRLFVAGQSVSLVGTWMQQVAMSWLVYRLTGSAFLLGVVGFTSQIPTFLFSPVAGVLADRWNRRRILMLTQGLAMVQAAVLAAAVLLGVVQVWHIVALSLVLGMVNAFDIPVRQSFVVEMVAHRDDLGNAIALNSSMVNGARLIGPTVAGLLVASVGEGICFLLNSASYLAVLLALAAMRIEPRAGSAKPRRHVLHELKEGFVYSFGFAPIRSILLLIALMSLTGMPYTVLVPVFAKDILHGGAHTFGFLMTAAGCGALAGTVYLASRGSVLGLGRLIVASAALFAVGVAGFALSETLWLSLASLVVAGYGAMTLVASCNTILQTILEEDKRGRVMSFFTVAFMGMAPFGSLGAGAMTRMIGPRDTLLLGAICCLIGAVVFARNLPRIRQLVRPIYVQMGIIKEVAEGMETAAEQPPMPNKER
ncbi:membrane protein, major facilitator superfamily [Citrifermentans bemidjiense Bem]|uniref:Membrane protein, major facilitator superfamily n=1 Tax=Citrifermentans bemidjiense (strain ATCC BAA-1014 / DSM 16622 / JCM 12645 / Bem) TaxID=404380 RepID=B5EHN3_CITBB|nr:MFS transporter [Citrifermentans bemidjiense]ACH38243.1 membrane protein, major facilitator superfamily [Citrifermentans bemidjiense Bem]